MNKLVLIIGILLTISSLRGQDPNEEVKAVKDACFDYIHAFYRADTTLAYRSVHHSLRKTGFFWKEKDKAYSDQLEMPFQDLIALAKRWNADGTRADDQSPKNVDVFEVSDKTAIAKVSALWGIDYISLMKIDDKWMIVNVLWQSPPKMSIRNP